MRPGDAIAIAYRPDKQMLYRSATQKPYRLAGAPLRGIRGSVCSAWPINWSRDRTCRAGAIVTLTRRIGGRPNTERAGQVPLPACSQRPASMRGFFAGVRSTGTVWRQVANQQIVLVHVQQEDRRSTPALFPVKPRLRACGRCTQGTPPMACARCIATHTHATSAF